MIEETRLGDGSPLKVPAVVPKLSATPGGTRWLGPNLGEHTDAVLADLGYDAGRIERLRASGVI
jgi:crotonobetainyl-CoA:carnitine CoA-transferase CaiB-like acyl-CoA transferase